MQVDVYAPVLLSLLLGLFAGPVGRRLPPRTAVHVIVPAAVSAAVCWLWALALLVWTAIGQLSYVAGQGHWSRTALHADDPVAGPIAWTAGVALAGAAAVFVTVTARRVRAVWVTRRLAAELCRTHPQELVVLTDDTPQAYALPGRRGHIVVSTAMVKALDPGERRVLFAHERAHLDGRHHLWLTAAQLAGAADPLLARLPATVHYLLERWADETAAEQVADRRLAAQALCRAGLATLRTGASRPIGVALAFPAGQVRARVNALIDDPVPTRWLLIALIALVVLLAAAAAVDAGRDAEHLFELAMRAYRASGGTAS